MKGKWQGYCLSSCSLASCSSNFLPPLCFSLICHHVFWYALGNTSWDPQGITPSNIFKAQLLKHLVVPLFDLGVCFDSSHVVLEAEAQFLSLHFSGTACPSAVWSALGPCPLESSWTSGSSINSKIWIKISHPRTGLAPEMWTDFPAQPLRVVRGHSCYNSCPSFLLSTKPVGPLGCSPSPSSSNASTRANRASDVASQGLREKTGRHWSSHACPRIFFHLLHLLYWHQVLLVQQMLGQREQWDPPEATAFASELVPAS